MTRWEPVVQPMKGYSYLLYIEREMDARQFMEDLIHEDLSFHLQLALSPYWGLAGRGPTLGRPMPSWGAS